MTDTPTVVQALSAVMADVIAVRKGDRNTQQGFSFRGIDAVVNAVGPALRKHGVVVVPQVEDAHYQTVTVGKNATPMRECTLRVRYAFHGPAGDTIEAVTYGEALDSGDKATAKAHSVAMRTALLQALCIPTDEPDPDSQTYERAAEPPRGPTDAKWLEHITARINQADNLSVLKGLWGELLSEYEAGHVEDRHRDSLGQLVGARKAELEKAS